MKKVKLVGVSPEQVLRVVLRDLLDRAAKNDKDLPTLSEEFLALATQLLQVKKPLK